MSRRVAVVYPATVAWLSRCVDGVRRYAREEADWHLLSSPLAMRGVGGALSLTELRGWQGDGVIALIDTESELRAARKMGMPVVNLGSALSAAPDVPRVIVDHHAAGRLAAEHLVTRGLGHLAFFGWKSAWYAKERLSGFAERAAEAGVTCETLLRDAREEAEKPWMRRITEPAKWLAKLPRPCGVFAMHDFMAQLLMEACQVAGLRIPEDIALLGMDDDETICERSSPTLSSIARNAERTGWEAAALLDRLMRGEPVPSADRLVPPGGVITRQSTDILHSAEPVVRRALDHMRSNLGAACNADELARVAGVSKRTLETRFRENLKSSPHEFLVRLRLQHACALLKRPEKRTVEAVALECGFGSPQAFYAAFKRVEGESPNAFRKRHAPR